MVATVRVDPLSRLVQIKSANRLPYVLAKIEAERRGMDDAILLNTFSHVVELSASNIFAYRDGTLITPPVSEGALPGITRATTLALGAQSGIQITEASFTVASLYHAEEVFATNSLFEVTPVIAIEDHPIPSGEITALLRAAYRELVREELRLR
jgi:branched-chain amino acid aminotransferase